MLERRVVMQDVLLMTCILALLTFRNHLSMNETLEPSIATSVTYSGREACHRWAQSE